MPFSHVRNSYQPEQLENLTEAFNLVWPQVVLANGTATDIELERIRHGLANLSLHAQAGESSNLRS